MHWLGKVLAILNLVGVLAVGCLACMDYAKRRAWAYSLFRHELVLSGLPVQETDADAQGRRQTELLSEAVLIDLFKEVGGAPVLTQQDEVKRLQSMFEQQISLSNDPLRPVPESARLQAYARVLLPLAPSNLEREHLLLYRNHFATKDTEAAFKARLQRAYAEAVKSPPEESIEKAFRQALDELGGGSAEPFTSALLRKMPDDRKLAAALNFEEEFKTVVLGLLEQLDKRFHQAFDEALAVNFEKAAQEASRNQVTEPAKSLTGDPRRVAIARLLFDLCPLLAEQNIAAGQGGPNDSKILGGQLPGSAGYQDKLLDTAAYKTAYQRTQVIVGLRAAADAVAAESQLAQQIYSDLIQALVADRLNFTAAHGVLLEAVTERASQVESEVSLLAREQKKLADQDALVKRRLRDVKQYEEDLAKSRAETTAEVKKLETMSEKLFKLRVILRDSRVQNINGEKKIRDLEAKIKELEKK